MDNKALLDLKELMTLSSTYDIPTPLLIKNALMQEFMKLNGMDQLPESVRTHLEEAEWNEGARLEEDENEPEHIIANLETTPSNTSLQYDDSTNHVEAAIEHFKADEPLRREIESVFDSQASRSPLLFKQAENPKLSQNSAHTRACLIM